MRYFYQRYEFLSKFFIVFVVCAFIMTSTPLLVDVLAQSHKLDRFSHVYNISNLGHNILLASHEVYVPLLINGMIVDKDNPLEWKFMLDTGHSDLSGEDLEIESMKLVKYFLASLATPEDEMWVNLSPYEKHRIIPESFGKTDMGKDMLIQDYILKQFVASLMYPEEALGKNFWRRVRLRAKEEYGVDDISINVFNKIWIVPESAEVYEYEDSVFIVNRHLKVLLELDYRTLMNDTHITNVEEENKITQDLIRDLLIPEIEKEVNEGRHFANLRQIYNSLILATWYKNKFRDSFLGEKYVNQKKIEGIENDDFGMKDMIYQKYLSIFKKGAYNYIAEEYNSITQELVTQRYFSGGVDASSMPKVKNSSDRPSSLGSSYLLDIRGLPLGGGIVDKFIKSMNLGLRGDKEFGLPMIPTYLKNGETQVKEGKFVVIDWGGTNIRVILVKMSSEGQLEELKKIVYRWRTEDKIKSVSDVFAIVANIVKDIILTERSDLSNGGNYKEILVSDNFYPENINTEEQIPLILGFGFAVKQNSFSSANFLRLDNKGWDVKGVNGQDIGNMLQSELNKIGLGEIKVKGITNDMLATHFFNEEVIASLGLGTGLGGTVTDPKTKKIYNVEPGFFSQAPQTDIDKKISENYLPKDQRKLEKMMGGRYIIKYFLEVISDMYSANNFMKGQGKEIYNQLINNLFFNTGKIIDIYNLNNSEKDNNILIEIFRNTFLKLSQNINLSNQEISFILDLSNAIVDRFIRLIAVLVISMVEFYDSNISKPYMIAITGSVYENISGVGDLVLKKIKEIIGGEKGNNIILHFIKDPAKFLANTISKDSNNSDSSPLSHSKSVNPGGIDFNPSVLDIQSKHTKKNIKISFNQDKLDKMDLLGIQPYIMNVTKVVSFLPYFGLQE